MTRAEEKAFEAYPVLFSERTGNQSPFPDRREAFQKGYEQAEKDLGWISVKERLPGPSEWVVVCVKGYGNRPQCLALATYNKYTKEWYTDDWENGEQEVYNPDYWMPIPAKVRKDKK